jgi:hypothetical protein
MMPSDRSANRIEAFYAKALRLYPPPFREAYAPAMRQTFHDALQDRQRPIRDLASLILRDLVISLAKEHLVMLRDSFFRPALLFNALVLAALATGLALALNTIPQQVLRLGADDPQIAIATDLVAVFQSGGIQEMLRQGALPFLVGGPGNVDMAHSLAPFVIVYDDQGHILASQAVLEGKAPTPPPGVFDYVRIHAEDRFSWQPRRDVRIAAVMQRVNGPQSGFVVAGRNMREVEARESLVGKLAGLTWIGMMAVILVGTVVFGWYTKPKSA